MSLLFCHEALRPVRILPLPTIVTPAHEEQVLANHLAFQNGKSDLTGGLTPGVSEEKVSG
jgi:hypothetical protein